MNTTSRILYLFTRTPLHVGAGSSVGAIDQPIQRERATGFPIVPGSSIKGVLRDACRNSSSLNSHVETIFGKQDDAGRLAIGEARILAFPVRSARGAFAFVTCPLALNRYFRELGQVMTIPSLDDMHCLAGDQVTLERNGQTGVVLEEYKFTRSGPFPTEIETVLLKVMDDSVWKAGQGRFVLLSDGDFGHFARNACEVGQHVGIDPAKGTARPGALFNAEAVPAEALFYAPITPLFRTADEAEKLEALVHEYPVLQFGGDSTTGLGFCSVTLSEGVPA